MIFGQSLLKTHLTLKTSSLDIKLIFGILINGFNKKPKHAIATFYVNLSII